MSNGIDLLRLLEPVVRPGGQSAPTSKPAGPIESRSFDSILADAQAIAEQPAVALTSSTTHELSDAAEKPPHQPPLRPLADVSQIENAALRRMLAQPASADTSNHKV